MPRGCCFVSSLVCIEKTIFPRKTFNSKFSFLVHKRLRHRYVPWMHKEIIKKRAFTWRALTGGEKKKASKKALCFIKRFPTHKKNISDSSNTYLNIRKSSTFQGCDRKHNNLHIWNTLKLPIQTLTYRCGIL